MHITFLLAGAIFLISLLLTMVGLGGGLIFSPLFVLLGMAKAEAASASLFLNLIAAASAAYTYSRKKMVDFSLAIPLIIASSLAAPMGSYLNVRLDIKPFLLIMAGVLALAGLRMLLPPPVPVDNADIKPAQKIAAASSTFIVCFSSLTGFLGYVSMEQINWAFILPAAVASFIGGQAGARIMSTRLKGKSIRIMLSCILFLLTIKMIHQFFVSL